ncbi:MAG TPA: acetyl-CoA C-acyltransferase [Steroidobacteraceae bacterium]|nr:acetyl-CoA C-acyltransferase [Steroidobacteraceae bacterium]HXX38799.1 acetyl-CoA C-acyltransferase [bacterium]
MSKDPVVILSARRTPVGAFQGAFAGVTAPQLGTVAIKAALADSKVPPSEVDEVFMGCVLPAGLGQAPARQAALGAGIPASVPATTVNKMCGSALRTIMLGADQILAGSARFVVAGGLESMTNAPYLLPKARAGYRMGHQEVLDHMYYDGLQSPWDGQLMGCFAEATAARYEFSRQAQDDFARESARRAQSAVAGGAFAQEVAPVTAKTRKGEIVVEKDETPGTIDIARIPTLKPAFKKDGTVTPASSASISDGAAAVVLTRESLAAARGYKPFARIVGYTSFATEPEWFTLAPVGAIRKLLTQLEWRAGDVDLYEVNEAFAVVTMAAMKDLGLDHAKVNVNGGACALGHPIGATGARLVTTLLHALKARGQKRGIASLCIGGGEATAIAVEMI